MSTVKAVAAETHGWPPTAFSASRRASDEQRRASRKHYVARVPIYPKLVHGQFRLLKWVGMAVMLGIYYGMPWLRWDRGPSAPDQAVLVDLVRERFYFFWIEIWPQEVYYITGLLILASLGLFLVTALFGRVWCGYACPQTVWTDLFIMVERLIEGDRNARIRLDKSPWTLDKVGKKSGQALRVAADCGGDRRRVDFLFPRCADACREPVQGHGRSDGLSVLGHADVHDLLARRDTCASRCAPICARGRAFRRR